MILSETSTTKSKPATCRTYASLRFMGDRLDPDRITAALHATPTLAYRKGEIWKRPDGKRPGGREYRGRSGLWLLSTRRQFESIELEDHFRELLKVLFPAGSIRLIEPLRVLMEKDGLRADVTCFWYGEHGAAPPVISDETRAAFAQIGAAIETDFQTD